MGTRYYQPASGRFISPDPMGHTGSLDLYNYAGGDPINFFDPDGRFLMAAYEAVSNFTVEYGEVILDAAQVGLDAAGMYPVFGIAPDLLNAGIHIARGNYAGAGFSAFAAIPVFGDIAMAGKYGLKGDAKISAFTGGQIEILRKNTGYNISPSFWLSKFDTLGKEGTCITNYRTIGEILGPVKANRKFTVGLFNNVDQVSYFKAWKLEKALGLERGSLQEGFQFSRINSIDTMNPRSPLFGNQYFQGPGKGLPHGGPEMIINPVKVSDLK